MIVERRAHLGLLTLRTDKGGKSQVFSVPAGRLPMRIENLTDSSHSSSALR